MSKVDSACEAIIREFSGNDDYRFEKEAEVKVKEKQVVVKPEITVKLSSVVNFRKIASEIRKTAAPVEVSYGDVNKFIKEISNE